jgi:hypothetical protein
VAVVCGCYTLEIRNSLVGLAKMESLSIGLQRCTRKSAGFLYILGCSVYSGAET